MGADIDVSADRFAAALEDIFTDARMAATEAGQEGVKAGAKASAKAWRSNARALFGGTGKYAKSVRSKVDRDGDEPQATVYSTMPGLPHLLEKGHATLAGNRVPGREHVAPAADEGFKVAFETAREVLEEGLK